MSTRDTSSDAARSLGETASELRSRIFVEICARGGATCDEIEEALQLRHQTASPRIVELAEEGAIDDSGQRRPTRSGRMATVWVELVEREPAPLVEIARTLPRTLDEVEAAGGYDVVYADPAWLYKQGGRGSTDRHYGCTSLARIAALPVRQLAAPDSLLFLWVTWPFLRDAFDVIDGWGFEYKTCAFVWVKYHEGTGKRCVGGGFWTRANTEFCLLCTRGKDHPRRLETTAARGVRQLIEGEPVELSLPDDVMLAPRQKHSAKPPEARERIRALLGAGPRAIELFARCTDEGGRVVPGGRVAAGFDQWGNECESDVYMGVDGEEVFDLLSSTRESESES